jgi:hypothetical protein
MAFLGACMFGVCMLTAAPLPSAFADGGVEMVHVWYGDGGTTDPYLEDGTTDVSPAPTGGTNWVYNEEAQAGEQEAFTSWKFALQFSKNVSWARNGEDGAFVEHNLALISLERADGKPMDATYRVRAGNSQDERTVIYIDLLSRLSPLTDYRIVADAGITAANGEDVSAVRYEINFRTDATLPGGMTVFGVIAIACFAVFIAAGLAIGALRLRRRRKEAAI